MIQFVCIQILKKIIEIRKVSKEDTRFSKLFRFCKKCEQFFCFISRKKIVHLELFLRYAKTILNYTCNHLYVRLFCVGEVYKGA